MGGKRLTGFTPEQKLARQRAQIKAWYQANKPHDLARSNAYRKARWPEYLAKQRALRIIRRNEKIKALGGVCNDCGIADPRVLQADHLKGNGTQQRKTLKSEIKYHKYLMSHLEEFQLLCANCNTIKFIEQEKSRYLADGRYHKPSHKTG